MQIKVLNRYNKLKDNIYKYSHQWSWDFYNMEINRLLFLKDLLDKDTGRNLSDTQI